MLNLEVQVAHPPVDKREWTWSNVNSVDGSVSNPINLFRQKHNEKLANCCHVLERFLPEYLPWQQHPSEYEIQQS